MQVAVTYSPIQGAKLLALQLSIETSIGRAKKITLPKSKLNNFAACTHVTAEDAFYPVISMGGRAVSAHLLLGHK